MLLNFYNIYEFDKLKKILIKIFLLLYCVRFNSEKNRVSENIMLEIFLETNLVIGWFVLVAVERSDLTIY